MIEIKNLTIGYPKFPLVIKGLSLSIAKSEVVNILGPNGCGKTTLLKALLGFLPAPPGQLFLNGLPLAKFKRKELARSLAYVPQNHNGVFPYTAMEVVLMGRTALSPWLRYSDEDYDKAAKALDKVRLGRLGQRSYLELSGGERRLVLIARALAQECACLIMDEPVSSLDYGNQFHLLDLIGEMANVGPAIVLTTHHPEQAIYLGGRAVLINDGRLIADGPVEETINADQVRSLYHLTEMASRWMR
jgi:iron complex transport system ATP-binding protein